MSTQLTPLLSAFYHAGSCLRSCFPSITLCTPEQTLCYRCAREEHCIGGRSGDSICDEFRTGLLCALCVPGYQRNFGSKRIECPSTSQAVVYFIAVIIGAAFVLSLQIYILVSSSGNLLLKQKKIREEYIHRALPQHPGAFRDEDVVFSRTIRSTYDSCCEFVSHRCVSFCFSCFMCCRAQCVQREWILAP